MAEVILRVLCSTWYRVISGANCRLGNVLCRWGASGAFYEDIAILSVLDAVKTLQAIIDLSKIDLSDAPLQSFLKHQQF